MNRIMFFAFIAMSFMPGLAFASPAGPTEQGCMTRGWHPLELSIRIDQQVYHRKILWKEPVGKWTKGALIALQGGGDQASYAHWCDPVNKYAVAQTDLTTQALAQGFGVFLLEATSDEVSDYWGRSCGKRWDTTVSHFRKNLDLPFLEKVITEVIPQLAPAGTAVRPRSHVPAISLVGISSGGYMAVRTGTRLDGYITAIAAVSSSDPYGQYNVCNPRVPGLIWARDVETNLPMGNPKACPLRSFRKEFPWESMQPSWKPPFKTFHHADDAVVSSRCVEKARVLLKRNGYSDYGRYEIPSQHSKPNVEAHLWRAEYNQPILDFFGKVLQDHE